MLVLAAAYYAAAKLGQTLRYAASVSAIWPPVGLGIAALYLWGLRLWPGVFIGELLVNGELLLDDTLPLGSLAGQQTGNMAEIIIGAILLKWFLGPRTRLDRVGHVGGMVLALAIATAISATVGTVSALAGGVIEGSDATTFWRTWWLGDTSGGLVALPLILAWATDPAGAWRRIRNWEGALLIGAVVVLSVAAVSTDEPVTYIVFPALIWAAFRFGPAGVTLSIAIAAGVAIGVTANELGPFARQTINDTTLDTQAYIAVAALTTLLLSAVVSERERSARKLAEAKRHEGEQALDERQRIGRDLHDSVSQSLFSTLMHTRTAQKALGPEGVSESGPLGQALIEIGEATRRAQSEMRALMFELRREAVEHGLVEALANYASGLGDRDGLVIEVHGPDDRLAVSPRAESELFGIGREALANVLKHSQARTASVRAQDLPGRVVVEIRDDGIGFDVSAVHPGHFGLESMRSRADEIGGLLTITSTPGQGTVVRVEAPATREGLSNGG